MAQNNFWIDLVASLKKAQSKKQIQSDAKNLGDIKVPLIGTLNKTKTRAQLKQDLASLNGTINLTGKVNKKGIVTSVQQATQQAQNVASKSTIQVSMNLKKDKLINDIKVFGQQNTKLFKDANMTAKYNSLLDNAKLATSSKEIQNLRMQLSAMRSEIKATNLSGLTLGDTFKKTFKRATELFTGTGVVMMFTQQMRQAWREALNLDKAYTDLIKVQDELSRGDYPEYLEQCNKKAQDLATTQQSLIEGATEFSKSGYTRTQSDRLSEKSTILSNVGDMSASDSAKAIISGVQAYDIVDGYDDVIDKAGALIDKYNEIGNTASITTAEIAEGVQKVGSVFADANTSVDEFIAMLAAGNRQFQDADTLSLGLRTAALRIRACKTELESLGEETDNVYTSSSKVAEKIEALTNVDGKGGVQIFEADGETFRSIYDIFVDISKVYQQMSDTDQSALLDLIAGKNRASAISATLNNMSEAQEIYERSLNATGSAQREYDKYLSSSEASLNKFKASMTETYQSVINGETVTGILNCGNATLQFVNSLGLVESTLKGLIAIGIVKAVTTLSTAFKASAIQASNFGTALNAVKNMSTMAKGTTEYTNALRTLKTVSIGLSETQLKQVLASKSLSDSERIAILRTTGLTKAQAQAKLAQMGLTQSTKAQTTANASATASTFSLTAAVKGFGVSLKAAFMSNPIGISIMALSTIIGAVSSKVSEYNEKLRETRQANMDAATSAKEKADSLRDLYVQYENLNSITNRTSSQEEQFKQVVIDITKALGDKASALEGLTAGTDEYTASLKEATKAELESQYATAKIGAKAAEEDLKDKTYDSWSGSQITIQQNEQMTGVEEHMAALNAVKDILKEYETLGMVGDATVLEWKPIGFDQNPDDMKAVVEYYQALIQARDKLVTADNADFLMSSDIYKDINTTINELSDSVEKYTEQQYQALKLNYEWQNGIPTTEEEFKKMETSILNASGAGKEFQSILKGYLNEDFATFSESTNSINDMADAVDNATQSISSIKSFSDAWEELKVSTDDSTKKLADNLTELAEKGRLTAETFSQTDTSGYFENLGISADEAVQKINNLTDAATQLDALSEQVSKMSDMLADKKNGTIASASDLAGFDATVKGLESWEEFERVMGSTTSSIEECQAAANVLATEWINNGNYLANLTDQNRDYYETQLSNMGIENAHVIVLENLAKAGYELSDAEQAELDKAIQAREEIYALQVAEAQDFIAKKDLNVAAEDAYVGLMQEAEGAGISKVALVDLIAQEQVFNNSGLSVSSKISQLSALASAYLGTASAAQFAANTSVSGMGSDPRYFTPDYVMDQWTNALSNYKVNFDLSSSGSSGYKGGASKSSSSGSGSNSKQTIDWIERKLTVLQSKIDTTKAKFDNLFTLKSKKNNLATQIKQTTTLLNATNKAADIYLKKANRVGLSTSLKKKVQSGSYSISDYSSETADKIQKYEDYYDKYKELKQQANELETDIRSLREERYQLYVDDAEAKIERSQALAELDSGNYKKQNVHLEAQKKYLEQEYKYLIKIAELNKDSVEVAKLKAELQKELNDLTKQEFDNIANTYDNKIGLTNNKIQAFQDQIDLMEAKGQQVGSALYTKQISLNNANTEKLVAEREKLIAKLAEISKGTDDWYDAQDTLFDVDSQLVQIEIDNANLQKSINQLKFDRFDDLLDKLNDIVDETEFLIDMLDSDNLFDDNGKITDDGITAMGLNAQKYDVYLAEAQKYKEQMAELERDYQKGDVDPETYEAKMREYKSGQQDMIRSANDVKKSLVSLVKQGLDAQNQALEKSVSKQKELLQSEKDLYDFQRKISDQNKNIADLQKQLNALEGDSSEEARKRKQQLKAELADAEQEQKDTLYDRSIEDSISALDKMVTDSEDMATQYLKDSEKVFIDALNYVNANTSQVSQNLEKIAKDTGYDISTYITNAWKDGGDAVGTYESTLSSNVPKITAQIQLITNAWQAQCEAAEKAAKASAKAAAGTDETTKDTDKKGNSSNGSGNKSKTSSAKDIKKYITDHADKAKQKKSYYGVLNQYIYDKTGGKVLSVSEEVQLAKMLGVSVKSDLSGSGDRKKILDALKKKKIAFANGGILGDLVKLTGEDGLFIGSAGESILTKEQTQALIDFRPAIPQLNTMVDLMKNAPISSASQSPTYNIEVSNNVSGAVSQETLNEMRKIATNQAETVIKKINNATYAKGVRK